MTQADMSGYHYKGSTLNDSHGFLLPAVFRILDEQDLPPEQKRLFELGCGNGSVAQVLTRRGWDVTGVDPSVEGIAQANKNYSHLKLQVGSAYDDLHAQYGTFPIVLSLEVVEHVYAPREYAKTLYSLIAGGGDSYHLHALS